MKKYQHVFFDLDHTLWDYERNAAETLAQMHHNHQLTHLGVTSVEAFVAVFKQVNQDVWNLYDNNLISQEELRHRRFRQIFEHFGIEDYTLCDVLNADYLHISPQKPHLIDFAQEILDYLHPRYQLHLITNGFDEIQGTKLNSAGITHYFQCVVTSQKAGAKKPSPAIFEYARTLAGGKKEDCLMIGDNYLTDIKGALAAGIDVVHLNPSLTVAPQKPTYTITDLRELKKIL